MPNVSASQILLLGSQSANLNVMTGVTTGTSQPIARPNDGLLTFYLRSIGATTGGTVLIEEADWMPGEDPYSGTWGQVASIAASSFTGGVQLPYHIVDSAYGYVRVRISSPITGGGSIVVTLRSKGDS